MAHVVRGRRGLAVGALVAVLVTFPGTRSTPAPDPPERMLRPVSAPAPLPVPLARHYQYIRAAQLPEGAIAMTPVRSLINPYFANVAARALLTAPGHLVAVERYLDWYVAHLNRDGSINDFAVAGGRLHARGYDSADSYAATFLSLVAAYVNAGGNPDWVPANRHHLDRIVALLAELTDADGLTWAKPRYPLKLLMDNSEVRAGWQDWAGLMVHLGETEAASRAAARAGALDRGLQRFRRPGGHYAWGLGPLGLVRGGSVDGFYPAAVAQFFPLAFGATDDPSGYLAFAQAYPDWTALQSDRFPWLLAAFAAARAGDRDGALAALHTADAAFPDLAPPWYVAESAWFILTATGE